VDWDAMVTVGRIVRPHGNRGQVVVASETDFADERFRPGSTLFIARDGTVGPIVVTASRPYDARWVVGFDGYGSIDEAETLRGCELRIAPEDVKPLEAGAYYVHDLVGCTVRTIAGDTVGTVERVDLGVGIPMLVVNGDGEVLVPFSDAICRRVSVADRVIEIDPPEGLIELNRPVRR
jgi:16S rRNA processing protein RimM